MGGLGDVDVEVVVGEHGTTHGGKAERSFAHVELVEHLGDEPMDRAVGATRAVVGVDQGERLGPCVYQVHVVRDVDAGVE